MYSTPVLLQREYGSRPVGAVISYENDRLGSNGEPKKVQLRRSLWPPRSFHSGVSLHPALICGDWRENAWHVYRDWRKAKESFAFHRKAFGRHS